MSTGATAAQAAANPTQPVAAAVVLDSPINTAPAGANSSAAAAVTGSGSTKIRFKATAPLDADQDAAPAQAGKTTAAAKPASSATGVDGASPAAATASSDSSGGAAGLSEPSSSSAPQAPILVADDVTAPAPGTVSAGAGIDSIMGHAAAPTTAATAAAGAQSGSSPAANSGSDSVPNVAFSAANAVSSSAATTTSGASSTPTATSTAAVPIAGLAVAIAARAQEGSTQFAIRLDPPELGRIEVHLDVDRDGQVTSQVTVDRADTLQLLQNQQPHLERALEQAGLKTADNGLSFTLRDQSFTGQNNNGGNGGAQSSQAQQAQLVVPDADLPSIAATQAYSRYGLGSGVDIRV